MSDELGLNLEGKVVLITGASGGIGFAIAKFLCCCKAKVILTDIFNCEDKAKKIGAATSILADISKKKELEILMQKALKVTGKIDGLIHCAALLNRVSIQDVTSEDIEKDLSVNQVGTFFLSTMVAESMKLSGGGKIVLFTSQGAFTGGFHGSQIYGMSKAAIGCLVKSLAGEYAKSNITVNALAPGAIDTKMLRRGMTEQDLTRFLTRIPLNRFGKAEEVAKVCAFLVSDWSSYITGTTIHVNGGQIML